MHGSSYTGRGDRLLANLAGVIKETFDQVRLSPPMKTNRPAARHANPYAKSSRPFSAKVLDGSERVPEPTGASPSK